MARIQEGEGEQELCCFSLIDTIFKRIQAHREVPLNSPDYQGCRQRRRLKG